MLSCSGEISEGSYGITLFGMEQRTVAGQFFRETFVMGMAAVLSGCVFGTVLSGVMTLFVMKMVGRPASFRLGLYPDTMLITCLFFGIAFVLVGAFNARRICRLKLIDLLNEKKAGEGQGMGKRKYVLSFIVALLCFGVDAVALYNFSGMNGVYAGDIPAEVSNRYQAVAIVAAVIGIFAFYHAVLFVLSLIRRAGKWKNRGINSVLLGSLFQKISSTAKVLSISTLAVTVSLVAFVVLPTLAEITTGYLEYRMPYHVMIYNTYRYIDEMDDIPQIDFSFVGEILRRHGVEVSEEVAQESYFVWERDFNTVDTREHWRDLPRLAMGISDYNRMREMAGFPPVPLGENEFFMHLDYEMDMEEMAGSIRTRTLELDDGTQLGLAETAVYNEPIGKYLFNSDGSILVFPDDVCGRLHLARTCYYANTQTAVPYGGCNVIRDEINAAFRENYGYLFERYEEKYQSDRHYVSFIDPIRFWTQENNDVVLTAVSVRLLGIYAGTIFFIICMTVLALHLITDSVDFSAQYRTLHQIGVEREDIAGMVSRKSFCYFFVPFITAFVIALSVIYSFAVRYGHKILTYMGTSGFQFGVLIPGLLVATELVCYYGITIYAIKRNLTVTLDLQAMGYPQKYKPLLSELKEIQKTVKEKSAERKPLSDEKDKCSVWEVGKQLQISRYLTTLTEDIEELKSCRTQIFAALECKEDSEVKALEKKADSLVDIRTKLEEQQKTLQNQKQETLSEYTETLNAIAQEDLPEVAKERNHIRYGGRTELIQKLRGIYSDKFIRRQYDISEKAVDEILPIGEIPRVRKSISEQLKQPKQEVQNREQPTKMKRRDDWER